MDLHYRREGIDDSDIPDLCFTDTYIAITRLLQNMKDECTTDSTVLNVVFVHQLIAYVHNETIIMEELRLLKEEGIVRVFRCNLGTDIFAVMMMHDYCCELEKRFKEEGGGVYKKFVDWIHKNSSYSVFRTVLERSVVENASIIPETPRFTADDIQTLLLAGFLIPRRDCNTGSGSSGIGEIFWVSHPGINKHSQLLLNSRDALVSVIKKSKYKEISMRRLSKLIDCSLLVGLRNASDASVGKKRKRNTSLLKLSFGFKYHLYDLLGCRLVEYANDGLEERNEDSILRLCK